jgi:hypothetical protein
MAAGMYLRSNRAASHISDPHHKLSALKWSSVSTKFSKGVGFVNCLPVVGILYSGPSLCRQACSVDLRSVAELRLRRSFCRRGVSSRFFLSRRVAPYNLYSHVLTPSLRIQFARLAFLFLRQPNRSSILSQSYFYFVFLRMKHVLRIVPAMMTASVR